MSVIAASEIRGQAATTDKQLKTALSQWLDSPPRRVDRLILQALLGAAALKDQVRSDCGLYLAARYPSRSTMGTLLDTVCVQQHQPKPFEFVNSVSNSAGFHVAQQLGLEGPNLFIGAGEQVWSQLLSLAQLDLHDGLATQALLVFCDEQHDFCVQALLLEGGEVHPQASDFVSLSADVEVRRLVL
nr:hypothetical protein [uncultured Pseudomonas sp.]